MEIGILKSAFKRSQYPPADRPEIAFAGRSNVGKSSLINVLVRRKGLAKTSSRPGRTQAINFFETESLFIVDLPGYGFARVPIDIKKKWQEMIEDYLLNRETLKSVVVVLDIRRGLMDGDRDLLEWLHYNGIGAICVFTKSDKLSKNKASSQYSRFRKEVTGMGHGDPILFSARTANGRKELWMRIAQVCSLHQSDLKPFNP